MVEDPDRGIVVVPVDSNPISRPVFGNFKSLEIGRTLIQSLHQLARTLSKFSFVHVIGRLNL